MIESSWANVIGILSACAGVALGLLAANCATGAACVERKIALICLVGGCLGEALYFFLYDSPFSWPETLLCVAATLVALGTIRMEYTLKRRSSDVGKNQIRSVGA